MDNGAEIDPGGDMDVAGLVEQQQKERARRAANRKRAAAAAKKGKVTFQRILSGLYINHPLHFTLSRDLVWNKGERPRWTAKWEGFSTCGVLRTPATMERRFDSMAEARAWCEKFAQTLDK